MADRSFNQIPLLGHNELLKMFLDRTVFLTKQKIENLQSQIQQLQSTLTQEMNSLSLLQSQLNHLNNTLQADRQKMDIVERPNPEMGGRKLVLQPQFSMMNWRPQVEPQRMDHQKNQTQVMHKSQSEQQKFNSLVKKNKELHSARVQQNKVMLQSQVSNLQDALQKSHTNFSPPTTTKR